MKLDRLQCSPGALIGVILLIVAGGAMAAGSKRASPPAPVAVAVPQAAAAGHSSHLVIGLILAGAVVVLLTVTAAVVRRLRSCGCWRPGTAVPALRMDRASGTLQPVKPAETVAETGSDGSPVVLSPEGVSKGGVS